MKTIMHADYNRPIENEDRLNLVIVQRVQEAAIEQIIEIVHDTDGAALDDLISFMEHEGASEDEISELVEKIETGLN